MAHNPSILQPRFARRIPTVNLPPLVVAVYTTNFMVEPKQNISELQFRKFPTTSPFLYWRTNFKTQECSVLGHPSEALLWMKEVEGATSVDDLETSRSITGNFSELRDAGRKDRNRTEEHFLEFQLQEKCSSRRPESSKRRPISLWKADRVYDVRTHPNDRPSRNFSLLWTSLI